MNVSSKTKNADTSVALLDFFLNSVDAAKITTLDEGAPSSKAIRAALLPTLNAGSKAFIDQIDREMSYPRRPLPVRPKGNEDVNSALTRYSQAVAYGKQSVSDAAKGLMADSQAALK
jgi:multiple sugar transport system substrate-binding protein